MNKFIFVLAALLLVACDPEGASGKAGPRGPAGHQGLPGLQGPAGGISKSTLAHLNNVEEMEVLPVDPTPDGTLAVTAVEAACKTGDLLLSGGCAFEAAADEQVNLVGFGPMAEGEGYQCTWQVKYHATAITYHATARCVTMQ